MDDAIVENIKLFSALFVFWRGFRHKTRILDQKRIVLMDLLKYLHLRLDKRNKSESLERKVEDLC